MRPAASRAPARLIHALSVFILVVVTIAGPIQPTLASPVNTPAGDQPPPPPNEPTAPVVAPPEPLMADSKASSASEIIPAGLSVLPPKTLDDGTQTADVSASGGAVSFLDGRVTVIVQAGTFKDNVQISIKQHPGFTGDLNVLDDNNQPLMPPVEREKGALPPNPIAQLQFTLTATGSDGEPIEKFVSLSTWCLTYAVCQGQETTIGSCAIAARMTRMSG